MDVINVIKIILFPLQDIHVYMHTGEKPHKIRNRVSLKLMSGDVNAPVICIPGSLGAGDSGDIAGPKFRDLTFDESRQSRRCAGGLISRQNNILCHILQQGGSSACTFAV